MSGAVTLPARMDTAGAVALEARLEGADAIEIDASQVEMIGGLCLEVVLDAIRRRIEANTDVSVTNPSEGFRASLATFGCDPDQIAEGGYSQ